MLTACSLPPPHSGPARVLAERGGVRRYPSPPPTKKVHLKYISAKKYIPEKSTFRCPHLTPEILSPCWCLRSLIKGRRSGKMGVSRRPGPQIPAGLRAERADPQEKCISVQQRNFVALVTIATFHARCLGGVRSPISQP
jgi:hypothetical protein